MTSMLITHSIGLGDYRIAPYPAHEEKWVIYGIGSCIGLILCDRLTRISAMAHIVLPEPAPGSVVEQPGKFAVTAVPFLLERMIRLGASPDHVYSQIAGGACMLRLNLADIGAKNIQSIRAALQEANIPIIAEDVGGNHGRTLHWDLRTGKAIISRIGMPDVTLTPPAYLFRKKH